MNAYKANAFRTDNAVVNGVTLLVSAWFLVAGAAILSDPTSAYTHRNVAQAPSAVKVARAVEAPVEIAPQARLTIVVEARRAPVNRVNL